MRFMLRLTTETQRTQRRHREDRMNPHLNQLSHGIIGAAIEVHRTLGPGLLESSYHECLCRELLVRDIPFEVRNLYRSSTKVFDQSVGIVSTYWWRGLSS